MGGRTPHREGKSQSATSKPNTGGLTYAVEVKGICSECSLPQLKTRVIEHITELHGLSDGFVRARPSCKHGRSIRCTDNCDIARTRRFETVLMGAISEEGDSQERGEQDAQLGTHWSEDKAVSEFPLSAWCCDQSTAEMSLEGAPERERDASPGLGQTSEKKKKTVFDKSDDQQHHLKHRSGRGASYTLESHNRDLEKRASTQRSAALDVT